MKNLDIKTKILSLIRESGEELYLWKSRDFILNSILAFFVLVVSAETSHWGGVLATQNMTNSVGDVVLSNFRKIDTSFIHGQVATYISFLSLFYAVFLPRFLPFLFKGLAFLIVTQSIFINMTYLAPFYDTVTIQTYFMFPGSLFFSGHSAYLFFLSLTFWSEKPMRYLFLTVFIASSLSSLLGHYHYTIDVATAPFIAYGIFTISKKMFEDDFLLTKKLPPTMKK